VLNLLDLQHADHHLALISRQITSFTISPQFLSFSPIKLWAQAAAGVLGKAPA
jgi:hypothetical protein